LPSSEGVHELAAIIKLTFTLQPDGSCRPAELQEPLVANPGSYEQLDTPLISPPAWDCDFLPFKPGTDVVVQGHAYTYNPSATCVDAEILLPNGESRVIRAYGDRRLELHRDRLAFTPPAAFEIMPLRFDRAYGGFDAAIEQRETDWVLDRKQGAEGGGASWYSSGRQYYPRNPCGIGFCETLRRGSPDSVQVPNLEYPVDPITPERLAVGSAENWLDAPLPAAFDWYAPSWFPRIAYLGLTPEHTIPADGIREITLGWAAPNLIELPSLLQFGYHGTFQHGASPALIQRKLEPGCAFLLRNLFPEQPEQRVQLPQQVPHLAIHVSDSQTLATTPRLGAVVIRPDQSQLIQVWSARTPVTRPYYPNETSEMKWKVRWA
jgi:hypothetical protein